MKVYTLFFLLIFLPFTNLSARGGGGGIVATGSSCFTSETVTLDVINSNITLDSYYWYAFTPDQDGNITIDTTGFSKDADAYLYDSCYSWSLASDNSGDNDVSIVYPVQAGTTYYLKLELYSWWDAPDSALLNIHLGLPVDTPPTVDPIASQTTPPDISYTLNLANYVTTTNGDVIDEYRLTGTLPQGLSFSTSSGIISGTPTLNGESQTLTFSAHDKDGWSNEESFTISIVYSTNYHAGARDFELINPIDTQNIIGNTQIIGNTVECVTTTSYASSSDYSNLVCDDTVGNYNNNNYTVKYIDIDDNATTQNSSTATIEFPSTFKEIIWVGLFWQAHINNDAVIYVDNRYHYSDDYPSDGIEATNANRVLFKIGNSDYQEIIAQTVDYFSDSSEAQYSAFANITSKFLNDYTPNSTLDITIADINTTRGRESSLGNYGAWTLVVIYKEDETNSLSKLRNNSVYSGFQYVADGSSNDREIVLNDFLLPKNGTIDSQMAVFAAEGEYRYKPDTMELDGVTLGNPDDDNVFDARLSDSITRNPSMTNNNGIDIDVFDTSDIMTNKRDASPDAVTYSATISLTSDADLYLPSMVSFTTELYKPRVCYYIGNIVTETGTTIYQNGAFVNGASINQGEEYIFNFWISNMKQEGDTTSIERADKVQVYLNLNNFNYNTTYQSYLNNIDGVNDVANRDYVLITDTNASASDPTQHDDLGEHIDNRSIWRIGAGASALEGGTLNEAISFDDTINISYLNLKGSLNVTGDTTDIDLVDFFEFKASFQTSTITIGEENAQLIVQCQDLNTSGTFASAPVGAFNVVQTTFDTTTPDPLDPQAVENRLPTQVSNRNFNIRLLSLDTNDKITLSDYDGDVNISIIQTPPYTGDLVADQILCDEALPLNGTEQQVTFTNDSFKDLVIQNTPLALKNASFKVSYNLNTDTPKHVCSRDVFAIRPDRFVLTPPAGENIELLKSGNAYKFTIQALQYNSNLTTQGYNRDNVTSNFFNIIGDKYLPDGTLKNDLNGTLQFASTAFNIQNGTSYDTTLGTTEVATISFDDVGLVNIQLQDINWSQVDIDNNDTATDCSQSGAYVCGNINATFIPDHFTLGSVQLFNASAAEFTYLANDLDSIYAGISLTLQAENANNQKTFNFDSAAWEQAVNVTFSLPTVTGLTAKTSDINSSTKLLFSQGAKTIQYSDTNNSKNLKFNYNRTVTTPINPFTVQGANISVSANATYTASDGTSTTVTGTNVATQDAVFVYARTHAQRQRFTQSSGTAIIYYETFCNDTDTVGTVCDKSLLPDGVNAKITDDPRWFINSEHNSSFGHVGTVTQKGSLTHITAAAPTGTNIATVQLTYDENKGYPYKATMENNASSWLIYNKYDATDTTNEFEVEFSNGNSQWTGQAENTNSTNRNASNTTNRRTMW